MKNDLWLIKLIKLIKLILTGVEWFIQMNEFYLIQWELFLASAAYVDGPNSIHWGIDNFEKRKGLLLSSIYYCAVMILWKTWGTNWDWCHLKVSHWKWVILWRRNILILITLQFQIIWKESFFCSAVYGTTAFHWFYSIFSIIIIINFPLMAW